MHCTASEKFYTGWRLLFLSVWNVFLRPSICLWTCVFWIKRVCYISCECITLFSWPFNTGKFVSFSCLYFFFFLWFVLYIKPSWPLSLSLFEKYICICTSLTVHVAHVYPFPSAQTAVWHCIQLYLHHRSSLTHHISLGVCFLHYNKSLLLDFPQMKSDYRIQCLDSSLFCVPFSFTSLSCECDVSHRGRLNIFNQAVYLRGLFWNANHLKIFLCSMYDIWNKYWGLETMLSAIKSNCKL